MSFVNYKTAAAWSSVVKKLGDFKRGDEISLSWLQRVGDIADGTCMEGRLRTHYRRLGIVIVKRGEAYRLLTDAEQKEHAADRRDHVKREDVRTLHEIMNVDRGKLDEKGVREADHLQRTQLARIDEHEKFDKEKRAILGVPEPRPRLRAVEK